VSRPGLLALLPALAACGADPPALTRVSGWSPQGSAVATDASAAVELSGAVGAEGILDGRRVALATAPQVRAAAAAVESEAGLGSATPTVPCTITLGGDGRRIELRPRAPLAPGLVHAVLLGPVRDAAGRPVLDAEGRRRTFVATFQTAPAPPGPPPIPVVTEVRAVAAAPEAGGEYVEVQNRGAGPLDLEGWRLEKRTASGALAGCTLQVVEGGPVPPGAFALLTGGAWDRRYPVPSGVARATCGTASLAGGLADDRAPEVHLVDPAGSIRSTMGAGGAAPRCPGPMERIAPDGPDAPANLTCAEGAGTPGACNASTPAGSCR
jgi:hypothetical protein